jgi:hypothetical protein
MLSIPISNIRIPFHILRITELIVPNISKILFSPLFQSVRDLHSGLYSEWNTRTIDFLFIKNIYLVMGMHP